MDLIEFQKQFPDDDTCLDFIMREKHPDKILDCSKCGKEGKHYKVNGRKSYSCAWCGHAYHPLVGTIFQKSRVSLVKWFYAIQLVKENDNKISALQLQRHLGVTYKTAWRILELIRQKYYPDYRLHKDYWRGVRYEHGKYRVRTKITKTGKTANIGSYPTFNEAKEIYLKSTGMRDRLTNKAWMNRKFIKESINT